MRVPLGVVGQAMGVASFPFLAQLYSQGKHEELNRTLNATLKGLLALLVPLSALTIAMNKPLVHFVFSHTRLRGPDLDALASTLAIFSIGMFAWGAQNILARGFYAARDTLTPAIVGTVLTFLSLPLYALLVRHLQHLGLAWASSCGIVLYTLVLFVLLNRRLANHGATDLTVFFLKIGVASTLAGFACFLLTRWLGSRIGWQTTLHAFLVLVLVSGVGIILTVIFAKLLRVREMEVYLKNIGL